MHLKLNAHIYHHWLVEDHPVDTTTKITLQCILFQIYNNNNNNNNKIHHYTTLVVKDRNFTSSLFIIQHGSESSHKAIGTVAS